MKISSFALEDIKPKMSREERKMQQYMSLFARMEQVLFILSIFIYNNNSTQQKECEEVLRKKRHSSSHSKEITINNILY